MLNNKDIITIEKIINKNITDIKLLSNSFRINCVKVQTENDMNFVVKFYQNANLKYNAIKMELDNLLFLKSINLNFFPNVYSENENYLIMSFLENNGIKPEKTHNDLLDAIVAMHSITSEKFGFSFNTQIGGLKQINTKNKSWVEFYRENRLGYIFELINSSNIMENSTNKKIERLLKNLDNYIPNKPKASLLHGDLWEGNILFNNKSFVGFIDPGSFYGHNEMEVAYLRWFNPSFIDENFLDKYGDRISLDQDYINYEPIYQLYYSLMNVYLWDKSYIADTNNLLESIKI